MTYRNVQHLALRGGLYINDPEVDSSISTFCAFFLVSPKVHNMAEMLVHHVSLPDFPRHSWQRDFAILGKVAIAFRCYDHSLLSYLL